MSNDSKISIVTISYNNSEGLRQTIDSVKKQRESGANFEYIVIDGKSTDNTPDIIEKNKELIDVLICEKDTGIYNAMNKGLRIATGDSIVFMNSGDVFFDEFNLAEFQNKYDFSKAIFTYTVQSFEDLRFLRPKRIKDSFDFSDFGHQGVYVPKSVYKEIFFEEERPIDADYFWMKKVWEQNNYVIAPETTAVFGLGGVSNNYTWKNVKKLYKYPRSVKYCVGIFIKFILQNLLGQRKFYKLIFAKKYDLI